MLARLWVVCLSVCLVDLELILQGHHRQYTIDEKHHFDQ